LEQDRLLTFQEQHSLLPVAVKCPLALLGPPEPAYQARALFENHVDEMMALVALLKVRIYTVVLFDNQDTQAVFAKLTSMRSVAHPDATKMAEVQNYLSNLVATGDAAFRGMLKVIKGAHGIEAMKRQIAQFSRNENLQKWHPSVNILLVKRNPESLKDLFLIGTMDNAMQKYQMSFCFADVVQRLHNQQVALREEYEGNLTYATAAQRQIAFKRAKNKLRSQLSAAMMLTSQNFGLHWMCASVSDVVWEPLQMVLTGQFDEDANDGSWKIPTSHTNLTKIKNVDDAYLVAQLRKVLDCTLTLKQFNIECQLYKVREKIYAQNWSMLRSYLSADEQLALDAVDGQYWEKLAHVTGPFPAWETCIEEIVQGHKGAKLTAQVSSHDVERMRKCLEGWVRARSEKLDQEAKKARLENTVSPILCQISELKNYWIIF